MTTPDTNQTNQLRFLTSFRSSSSEIETNIHNLSNTPADQRATAIDGCLAQISRLSSEVEDASGYLPAYDLKGCAETIKSLSDLLTNTRAALAPKKKFAFKSGRKPTPSTAPAEKGFSPFPAAPANPATRSTTTTTETVTLSHTNVTSRILVLRPPVQASRMPYSITASHLSRSLLLTTDSPSSSPSAPLPDPSSTSSGLATATLQDITHSLILLQTLISGPLHITGLKDSTLVVAGGARQLRLHDCERVDLYLWVGNRWVVEGCKGLRVAPYGGLKDGRGVNMWDQIDDFNWLQYGAGGEDIPSNSSGSAKKNPHWSVIPEEDRIGEQAWEAIVRDAQLMNPETSAQETETETETEALGDLLRRGGVSS